MIDSLTERVVTLAHAADWLPRRRRGRKTNVSTLYRWASAGCRGVVLETIQVGGTRCTSEEALQRFFERLTSVDRVGTAPSPAVRSRTSAQRRLASEAADRELARMGA